MATWTWRASGVVVGLLVASLALGCGTRKRSDAPSTRPLGPPLFDGRKGGGSFPLDTTNPVNSVEALRVAMEAGYHKRLQGPTTQSSAVTVATRGNDELRSVAVQVSGWRVRTEFKPSQLDSKAVQERVIRAGDVSYVAEPLKYEKGELSLRLDAKDAVLHVLKDKSGQRGLVLAGAKQGELHFHAPMKELRQVFSAGVRKGAGGGGIMVSSVTIDLVSDHPRRLDGTITVKGSWLLLPLSITVSGSMEVDDTMHANFSRLGATGTGPAGDLIAPFVDRTLQKVDGRRSPLMVFRDGKTKAVDFSVYTGETFDLRIKFGQ